MNSSADASGQTGPTSSFFGGQNGIQGTFIAGVAATSSHQSIRVWNKKHRYDEWEFLGLDMGIFGIQVGMPTASAGPGTVQQPGTMGSGFGPGNQGINQPSSFGPSSNSPQ